MSRDNVSWGGWVDELDGVSWVEWVENKHRRSKETGTQCLVIMHIEHRWNIVYPVGNKIL